jgi:hypothetical protein
MARRFVPICNVSVSIRALGVTTVKRVAFVFHFYQSNLLRSGDIGQGRIDRVTDYLWDEGSQKTVYLESLFGDTACLYKQAAL